MAPKRKPGFAGGPKAKESPAPAAGSGSPPLALDVSTSFPIPSQDAEGGLNSPSRRR